MLKAGSSLSWTSPLDTLIIPHIREKVNSQNAQTFALKIVQPAQLCENRRAHHRPRACEQKYCASVGAVSIAIVVTDSIE